MRVLKLLWPYL